MSSCIDGNPTFHDVLHPKVWLRAMILALSLQPHPEAIGESIPDFTRGSLGGSDVVFLGITTRGSHTCNCYLFNFKTWVAITGRVHLTDDGDFQRVFLIIDPIPTTGEKREVK